MIGKNFLNGNIEIRTKWRKDDPCIIFDTFLRFSAPWLCLKLAAHSIERGGKTTRLREEEASVT
jgi:hypothetical protein